jgi:hypothetical protein
MSSSFFATPEEQCAWLKQFFEPSTMWCIVRDKTRHPYHWQQIHAPEALETFARRAPFPNAVQVALGRHELSAPEWRTVSLKTGEQYDDLDFIRSQAVSIYLSLYSDAESQRLLFEGSIGVAKRVWYQDAGVDPEPLYRWYYQIKRRWWKMMDRRYTPVYRGTAIRRPIPVPHPYIAVSYGAVQWCVGGGRLKSADTHAVYDVVSKEEAKAYEHALRLFQCPERTQRCRRCQGGGEIPSGGAIQVCTACGGTGCAPEGAQ